MSTKLNLRLVSEKRQGRGARAHQEAAVGPPGAHVGPEGRRGLHQVGGEPVGHRRLHRGPRLGAEDGAVQGAAVHRRDCHRGAGRPAVQPLKQHRLEQDVLGRAEVLREGEGGGDAGVRVEAGRRQAQKGVLQDVAQSGVLAALLAHAVLDAVLRARRRVGRRQGAQRRAGRAGEGGRARTWRGPWYSLSTSASRAGSSVQRVPSCAARVSTPKTSRTLYRAASCAGMALQVMRSKRRSPGSCRVWLHLLQGQMVDLVIFGWPLDKC